MTDTILNTDVIENKGSANDVAATYSASEKTAVQTCPLNEDKIQLLPIRYAFVENLKPDASVVATQPYQSHPVGLRFIRDGWLYVAYMGGNVKELWEYQTKNGVIVKAKKRAGDTNIITNQPAIIIDKQQIVTIRVIFSELSWTDAKSQQVIDDLENLAMLIPAKGDTAVWMQQIAVGDISCAHQGKHILKEEIAKKWLAEVAEKHPTQTNNNYLFKSEIEPYYWEDKTLAKYKANSSIGQLKQQITSECKADQHVYIAIEDYVGMMQDLSAEQEKIAEWRTDWLDQNQGETGLKYTMGVYINAMLSLNADNAHTQGVSDWIQKLSAEKQQSIYDYINCANRNDKLRQSLTGQKAWTYILQYNSIPAMIFGGENSRYRKDINQLEDQIDQEEKQLRSNMLYQLGEDYTPERNREIEQLKKAQYTQQYGSMFGARGLHDLIRVGELKSFLDKQSVHAKRWEERQHKVIADRTALFTKYFHHQTWYFDPTCQMESCLNLEYNCIKGLTVDQTNNQRLSEFFEENPQYLMPGFHTAYTVKGLMETTVKFKDLLSKESEVIKAMQGKAGDALADNNVMTKIFGKEYWKSVLDISQVDAKSGYVKNQKVKNTRHLIEDTYSPLVADSIIQAVDEQTSQFYKRAENRVKNSLSNIEELVKNLNIKARAAGILAVRLQGFAVNNTNTKSLQEIQQILNDIEVTLKRITRLKSENDVLFKRVIERSTKHGMFFYKRELFDEVKYNQKDTLAYRDSLIWQEQKNLRLQSEKLAELTSPLSEGKAPFSLHSEGTDISYGKAKAFEAQLIKDGFVLKKGNVLPIFKSAWLPLLLTGFQASNLLDAWESFDYTNSTFTQKVAIAGSILGVIAGASSVVQAVSTAIITNAITTVQNAGTGVGGARLAAKLGKFSIYFGAAAQVTGGLSAFAGIIENQGKWNDAICSGDLAAASSAMLAMVGNYGSATISAIGIKHSYQAASGIYKRIQFLKQMDKVGKLRALNLAEATGVAWSFRGSRFIANMGRLNAPGLLFTMLQLIGESAFNYFNLSNSQRWYSHSCWGKDNKQWDLATHYAELAKVINTPTLIYLGEAQMPDPVNQGKVVTSRIFNLILTGQTAATIEDHPVRIEADWYRRQEVMDIEYDNHVYIHRTPDSYLTGIIAQNATIIEAQPLIIQFELPWPNISEPTKSKNSRFSQQKLVLNIGYRPDQATADIYNGKVSTKQLIFEVPLPLQDLNNGQEPRAYLPVNSEYKKFTGASFRELIDPEK